MQRFAQRPLRDEIQGQPRHHGGGHFQKGLGLDQQESVMSLTRQQPSSSLSGVIKWFDVSKGYGFIVPDNGGADILLHVTCLRRDGFQTAYEGARVVAEVLQRPKGYQCFRILSMTSRRRSIPRLCRRPHHTSP